MYKVQLTQPATEFIRGQAPKIQRQLTNKLKRLKDNPRPHGYKKIRGEENKYRIRSVDYRIVYEIYDDKILVVVVRIRHRKEVYIN